MPGEPIARGLQLQPGTLWTSTIKQADYALQRGALQPIPTTCEFIEQDGIRFLVRVLANLARKDADKKQRTETASSSGKPFNPFLPYDPDLFVADLSETHLCLLNKFNVVDHHLLIVTRSFEHQETLLTLQDFEAMWACLAEIEGLVFYNSGQASGASQPHKHLQLIPLPLVPPPFALEGEKIPIEPAIASAVFEGNIGTIPGFPFQHAIVRLNPDWLVAPAQAAEATLECYFTLLQAVGLQAEMKEEKAWQSAPYNLLATREWMLIIPRSQEQFQSIAVNALGFAGALLVRNQEQMQILKETEPLAILQNVAVLPTQISPLSKVV